MTYPHRQRANGFPLCACGAVPDNGPTSTWGADCPVAMREHIATLTTTLRDLRAQLDYIAHVGWDASCEAAAADALEAEDATRLNRYAVRVARERDEARAQLATTRRTLSAIDCRYTGGGVADVSGSHCPLGAPCERCQREARIEELERQIDAWKCAAPGGRRPCPDCKGTGDGPSGVPWCPRCDGEGYVELCEGCAADATTHDSEGVPLCAACYDALPLLTDEVSDAARESAARVDDVEGDL